MQDRNFDDIADKFACNIYGTTKGELRQAIIWQDLSQCLAQMPKRPLRILDAGGGEGLIACRLAALGHQVVLCDISSEMLSRAMVLAQEKDVQANMHFVHSPVQEIEQHLDSPVDLILFHAVLEWIADPVAALTVLNRSLLPGGVLSLMFYNYHGLFLRNVLLGNFNYINSGMRKKKKRSLSPDYPRKPEKVYRYLDDLGMSILGKSGVRVFHDYLQNKQQQQDDFAELLALEQRYCRQEPFINLGRYIHVLAQKPDLEIRE